MSTITDQRDTEAALAFLTDAYGHRLRREGRTVDHPIAVGRLLRDDHQPQNIVLAGLLHDVLEDTEASPAELQKRFGPEVTRLVEAMTENPDIGELRERKSALRQQVLDAGPAAATIALADKAAKLSRGGKHPDRQRLEHYRATLQGVEDRYGRSGLSELLRDRLTRSGGD